MKEDFMTKTNYRYQFEVFYLTSLFYQNPEKLIKEIKEYNSKLYTLMEECYIEINKQNGSSIQIPYKPDDFNVKDIFINFKTICVCIEMPKPERMPLCHRIYLVCNLDYTNCQYFAAEEDPHCIFFCGWTKNHSHENYGICVNVEDEYNIIRKIRSSQ